MSLIERVVTEAERGSFCVSEHASACFDAAGGFFRPLLRHGTGGRRLALRKAVHEACMSSGTAQSSQVRGLRGGLLSTLGCMRRLVKPPSRNICVCSSVGFDSGHTTCGTLVQARRYPNAAQNLVVALAARCTCVVCCVVAGVGHVIRWRVLGHTWCARLVRSADERTE